MDLSIVERRLLATWYLLIIDKVIVRLVRELIYLLLSRNVLTPAKCLIPILGVRIRTLFQVIWIVVAQALLLVLLVYLEGREQLQLVALVQVLF